MPRTSRTRTSTALPYSRPALYEKHPANGYVVDPNAGVFVYQNNVLVDPPADKTALCWKQMPSLDFVEDKLLDTGRNEVITNDVDGVNKLLPILESYHKHVEEMSVVDRLLLSKLAGPHAVFVPCDVTVKIDETACTDDATAVAVLTEQTFDKIDGKILCSMEAGAILTKKKKTTIELIQELQVWLSQPISEQDEKKWHKMADGYSLEVGQPRHSVLGHGYLEAIRIDTATKTVSLELGS